MVTKKLGEKLGLALLVVLILLFALFPFMQMLSTSLKYQFDWGNPSLIPSRLNLESYSELLGLKKMEPTDIPESVRKLVESPGISPAQRKKILAKFMSSSDVFPFLRYFRNSILLSSVATTISLILSVFAAYSFSRLKFGGRTIINRGILFVYMFGGVMLMVPLYQISIRVGIASTGVGSMITLILIYIVQTLPVSLYMLGNYFRTIPYSLEEAAFMDGCSRMKVILTVIIPLSKPMLITVWVYAFMIAWNEYLFASVYLKSFQEFFTLPVALQSLFVSKNAIWDRIMAASFMTALPVLAIFMFIGGKLTSGLAEGGVKE